MEKFLSKLESLGLSLEDFFDLKDTWETLSQKDKYKLVCTMECDDTHNESLV